MTRGALDRADGSRGERNGLDWRDWIKQDGRCLMPRVGPFYVLNNGMVYKFGKRAALELLKSVAHSGPPGSVEGPAVYRIDFDLSALTKESAKEKYIEIVRTLEFD